MGDGAAWRAGTKSGGKLGNFTQYCLFSNMGLFQANRPKFTKACPELQRRIHRNVQHLHGYMGARCGR